MSLHLVTGYKGNAHITSADQGVFNAGCVGLDEYVLATGRKCEAQIVANNTVRIFDGAICVQGRHVNIDAGTFVDIAVADGVQGMNRTDIIALRYTKDTSSGVESADVVVIQGTASASTAVDPTYTKGDILAGAVSHDMPLYRVNVVGLTIDSIEPMFNMLAPLADIQHKQNMLINGDFQCNQRGEKTYDVADTAKYTVDMWRAFQVKVQVLNEGVTLTGKSATTQGYFTQFIQLGKLKTTSYTIVAMVDGKQCVFTVTPGASAKEKNFGKFKISALTTSVWDSLLNDYCNKLKVNILPVGTSSFTLTYVDVFEGGIAYPHVKEDYATAIARCRRYIQKGCYVSPILASNKVGSEYRYQFGVCFDRMAHTDATRPEIEDCTWSYFTSSSTASGSTGANISYTSLDGMYLLRTDGTEPIADTCHAIKGVYTVTCEPRDA